MKQNLESFNDTENDEEQLQAIILKMRKHCE